MRFPSITGKVKAQKPEDWFWHLVLAGVICDFLYLGWLTLTLLQTK
jgi:hypothetical protein